MDLSQPQHLKFCAGNCRYMYAFTHHIDILQSGAEVRQFDMKNNCYANIKLVTSTEFMKEKAEERIMTCREELDKYHKLLLSKNLTVRYHQQYYAMDTFGTTNGLCLFLPGSKHTSLRHYLSLYFEKEWVMWIVISPALRYVVDDASLSRLLEVIDTINFSMWLGSFYVEKVPSPYLKDQNRYEVAVCFKLGFHTEVQPGYGEN